MVFTFYDPLRDLSCLRGSRSTFKKFRLSGSPKGSFPYGSLNSLIAPKSLTISKYLVFAAHAETDVEKYKTVILLRILFCSSESLCGRHHGLDSQRDIQFRLHAELSLAFRRIVLQNIAIYRRFIRVCVGVLFDVHLH
jgi:hypothetical protein